MNSTLSHLLSLDTSLHPYSPDSLPDSGWDRIRCMYRGGLLDLHLDAAQLDDVRDMLWDSCSDPVLVFKGQPGESVHKIFADGSIHSTHSGCSEVWTSVSEFVRERLLCDCDRDELTGTDARLADYAFSTVHTVTL